MTITATINRTGTTLQAELVKAPPTADALPVAEGVAF